MFYILYNAGINTIRGNITLLKLSQTNRDLKAVKSYSFSVLY